MSENEKRMIDEIKSLRTEKRSLWCGLHKINESVSDNAKFLKKIANIALNEHKR